MEEKREMNGIQFSMSVLIYQQIYCVIGTT